jgi:excisionase family DNA binding protein
MTGWSGSGELAGARPKDVEQKYLTLAEVAAYFSVPTLEIRDWIASDKLKATFLENGQCRVRAQDFLALLYRMMAAKERGRD